MLTNKTTVEVKNGGRFAGRITAKRSGPKTVAVQVEAHGVHVELDMDQGSLRLAGAQLLTWSRELTRARGGAQ